MLVSSATEMPVPGILDLHKMLLDDALCLTQLSRRQPGNGCDFH